MFYTILQFFIRLALQLFCRRITFSNKAILNSKGPLLLACNHPNSFLDAIIIGSQFNQPVHYLARGDAFKNPLAKKFLTAIKMMPIYRLSEGREYLALNDATFDTCKNILLQNGIVLIFSEGLCEHKWQLQPLKKGSARIAFSAWNELSVSSSFRVQPVSLNYQSFTKFGKQLIIHFGEKIAKEDVLITANEGEKIIQFNGLLTKRLLDGMLVANGDEKLVKNLIGNHQYLTRSAATTIVDLRKLQANLEDFFKQIKLVKQQRIFISLLLIIVLLIPAIIGFILHAPLYFTLKKIVQQKTKGTVFYDSVLFGLLLISYPIYWLIINVIVNLLIHNCCLTIALLLLPLLAWLCLVWKDAVANIYAPIKAQ
ncbi:MAG: 1-acyl-sn-glycerol-3-phosphate acyltransferase [Deinococcales bacterium]|nr:1-acyl-sn-glycerol-3-phosphate acyltransferase [Chitinophagaceae bacterium]